MKKQGLFKQMLVLLLVVALVLPCLPVNVFAAALDPDSHRLGELKLESGDCVVIGNEGHGMSKKAIAACDGTVFIPMSDGVESLNAATAAAVLVWEFFGKGGAI